MTDKPEQNRANVHVGIAEHGKLCALRGDYVNALRHYREALAMAARAGARELVMRHYLECVLESLELMGAYTDVHAYCTRAEEHYRANPPQHALTRFDLATIYQRRGVQYLKQGDRTRATAALELAEDTARTVPSSLPLCEILLRWCRAQLTISVARITAEQTTHQYFSVRSDTVRPERAISLPA